MLTLDQAKDLRESMLDVFTPDGDAGTLMRVRPAKLGADVWEALVIVDPTAVRSGYRKWYLLTSLDSAETL